MQEMIFDLDKKIVNSLDSFNARGTVEIIIRDIEGNIVSDGGKHNLIVKMGRSELIKKIAGTSTIGAVTKCGVGNGGTAIPTPAVPIAPIDGDTALYNTILVKNLGTATVDLTQSSPQVTFTTLFNYAEVNNNVNECALIFSDGTTLFARYTFPTVAITAVSGFSMEIDWTIQF